MFSLPIDFVAEFRGTKRSQEYEIRGEKVVSGERLFFEIEDPSSGAPSYVEVALRQLERDGIAHEGLTKGDLARLVGVVRCAERNEERGSQLVLTSIAPAKVPSPARAAA